MHRDGPVTRLPMGVDAVKWTWHGNWNYNGYGEQGALNAVTGGNFSNGLPSRTVHGNVVTVGVKYAF